MFQSHTQAGKLIKDTTDVAVLRVDEWAFLANNASYQRLSELPYACSETLFRLIITEMQLSSLTTDQP